MKVQQVAAWLIIITLIIVGLVLGQSILIPFIIAFLVWFIVKKIRNTIDKVGFIKQKVPRWLKTMLASVVVLSLCSTVLTILIANIESIIESYESYQGNIQSVAKKINSTFKVDLEEEIHSFFQNIDFQKYLTLFFSSLSELLGNAMMIIFYALFIFAEESLFEFKMRLLYKKSQKPQFPETLMKVDKMLSDYISLKSLVSLITAILSLVVFLIIGIDSPIFWTFIIFVMNFIPSIGSIIATVFPAFFCVIQFGGFTEAFTVLAVVGTIQVLVGNVVEPRIMGNTLNISPLVTILSMSFWGVIWGILGMVLSLPITVALIIVLSQFPSTRSVAILLSEKGKV